MNATVIDKKRRMTLPESVCAAVGLKPNDQVEWRAEAGEIRGRKLVAKKPREAFPRGSLLQYFTPERDREELAILSGCSGIDAPLLLTKRGTATLARRRAIREKVRDMLRLSATD